MEFQAQPNWKPEELARRVALILTGEASSEPDRLPYYDTAAQAWKLDQGNNWRLRQLHGNVWELNYRYSSSPQAQVFLEALKKVLEHLIGPR